MLFIFDHKHVIYSQYTLTFLKHSYFNTVLYLKWLYMMDFLILIYILLYIYIYIYALPHSVSLDHYVSGDQERKDKLNISRKKLCTV